MPRMTVSCTPLLALALAGAAAGLSAANASAQSWQAGTDHSNIANGSVMSLIMWDPDGAGGESPVLVALGSFTSAGTSSATRIAKWNGDDWLPLGSGLNAIGSTSALATLSGNHNLFFTGVGTTMVDGVSMKGIARYDGSSWFGMDTSTVTLMIGVSSMNADTIVACGAFGAGVLNDISSKNCATWNATTQTWSGMGSGVSSNPSCCLGLSDGHSAVVSHGGSTSGDGTIPLQRIGLWDGTDWHAMGAGFTTGVARCMVELDGDVIAGGSLLASGSTPLNKIGRWSHSSNTWSALGTGINSEGGVRDVYAAVIMHNGDLVVGGDFNTAGGATQNFIARWSFTTSTWSGMAPGDTGLNAPVRSLAVLPNGDLAVGGDFTGTFAGPGSVSASRFIIWHEPGGAPVTPPEITVEPTSQLTCFTGMGVADFSLTATGTDLTYQWQQQDLLDFGNYTNIDDGFVFDPFGNAICTAAGATTNHLHLSQFNGTAQVFRCVVTNSAGHADSSEVTLSFCYVDYDCNGVAGIDDIFVFLNAWFAGDPIADFDHANDISIDDIFIFLNAWFAGCV